MNSGANEIPFRFLAFLMRISVDLFLFKMNVNRLPSAVDNPSEKRPLFP